MHGILGVPIRTDDSEGDGQQNADVPTASTAVVNVALPLLSAAVPSVTEP